MKPDPVPPRPWTWPYPQTWRQVYAVITTMLLGFLAVAYLLDWLKGLIP